MREGECLAVQCSQKSVVRLRKVDISNSNSNLNSGALSFFAGPETFKSSLKIQENEYYKRTSIEECKENITNIIALQLLEYQNSLNSYKRIFSCDVPQEPFRTSLDPNAYVVIQANACKLEPVIFIGL